ncbi:MAG: transposase [Candidatus Moranbacteria bacterium]|nr:transposase [Candidatus Moranbacteria bacterium]
MKNYIGIDIAKNDFRACFKENQKEIKFDNTERRIDGFFEYLKHHKLNKNKTIIGLESTGAYHYRLFIKAKKFNYKIKVINPIIVNKHNQTSLRRVKNDKKDSRLIRYCLIKGYGYEFKETKQTIKLKALVRQRENLVNILNTAKRRQNDIEYKQDCIQANIENVYQKLNQQLQTKIKNLEKKLIKYKPKTQKL